MSWSYGFGLAHYVRRYPSDYQANLLAELSRDSMVPPFHEMIDGRIVRFDDGDATWLVDDSELALQIQQLYRDGCGSVPNTWEPFVEAECGVILPTDAGDTVGVLSDLYPFDALRA